MAFDRLPPQDVDTEAACLSSILLSRDALYKVTEMLEPEDFYLEKHRLIYSSIVELERKNLPVDLTTIKQRLADNKLFDKIGGDATLVELYQTSATSVNAKYYSKRIKELSLRRKLIEVAEQSINKCYDLGIETTEVLDEVESSIFKVTEQSITSDYKDIDSVLDETMNNITTWAETQQVVTGIASGFTLLDEMLTGFHAAELIIIAARPGMGKTAFALNIMANIAKHEKKAALFFSLEMPAYQLGLRLLCVESNVDSQRVRTGHINNEEKKRIYRARERFNNSHIYIDDTASVNIMEIRAKARRLAQKEELGMVIVDYLQLVTAVSRGDRHLQVAEISRFLKQLARELNIPVIALSQLNRAVENRADQIPTLSDLRESGSIEQDADVVMFIYREEKVKKDSEKKGIADIIVAKQRSGPVGEIPLKFWQQFTKFGNLEKVHSYDEASPNYESE